MKFDENVILTGWSDWWNRMDEEKEDYRKMDGLNKKRNKKNFRERIEPNTIL